MHLAVSHKAAGRAEIVIPCWKALSLKKRGFVRRGQVVTESHDLFLDGRDVTLNAESFDRDDDYIYWTVGKCNITSKLITPGPEKRGDMSFNVSNLGYEVILSVLHDYIKLQFFNFCKVFLFQVEYMCMTFM